MNNIFVTYVFIVLSLLSLYAKNVKIMYKNCSHAKITIAYDNEFYITAKLACKAFFTH